MRRLGYHHDTTATCRVPVTLRLGIQTNEFLLR